VNIVIVGSGKVGRALGAGWRKAGHSVTFATREPAKAAALEQAGFGAVPLAAYANVATDDVIVLAVPWSAVETSIEALSSLAGKVLIDTTDPHTATGQLALGFTDSGAETVARLSGAPVVKAFSTTGAANMADSRYSGRLMMPIAGDDADAKTIVMALAADLGFEPVDVGPLAMSRCLEPLAMLWIGLAYAQRIGTDFGFAILRR
jgi:predicted dinucleotide-binding enzyme